MSWLWGAGDEKSSPDTKHNGNGEGADTAARTERRARALTSISASTANIQMEAKHTRAPAATNGQGGRREKKGGRRKGASKRLEFGGRRGSADIERQDFTRRDAQLAPEYSDSDTYDGSQYDSQDEDDFQQRKRKTAENEDKNESGEKEEEDDALYDGSEDYLLLSEQRIREKDQEAEKNAYLQGQFPQSNDSRIAGWKLCKACIWFSLLFLGLLLYTGTREMSVCNYNEASSPLYGASLGFCAVDNSSTFCIPYNIAKQADLGDVRCESECTRCILRNESMNSLTGCSGPPEAPPDQVLFNGNVGCRLEFQPGTVASQRHDPAFTDPKYLTSVSCYEEAAFENACKDESKCPEFRISRVRAAIIYYVITLSVVTCFDICAGVALCSFAPIFEDDLLSKFHSSTTSRFLRCGICALRVYPVMSNLLVTIQFLNLMLVIYTYVMAYRQCPRGEVNYGYFISTDNAILRMRIFEGVPPALVYGTVFLFIMLICNLYVCFCGTWVRFAWKGRGALFTPAMGREKIPCNLDCRTCRNAINDGRPQTCEFLCRMLHQLPDLFGYYQEGFLQRQYKACLKTCSFFCDFFWCWICCGEVIGKCIEDCYANKRFIGP